MKRVSLLFVIIISLLESACNAKNSNNIDNMKEIDITQKINDKIQSGLEIPADKYVIGTDTLYVTLIGHGSLMFEYQGKIIHVDPYSSVADYSKLPKADLILITHEHADHLDETALKEIKKDETYFITSKVCNEILGYGEIVNNGETTKWNDIDIKAVPAYNIVHKRPDGELYHPKGRGNGYVLRFGEKLVYIAGDTENIPEMEQLKGKVEIAFLPKNLPYTMDDNKFIDAAKKVMPKYLYPYHMSEFKEGEIGEALADTGIKLRIRPMSNK